MSVCVSVFAQRERDKQRATQCSRQQPQVTAVPVSPHLFEVIRFVRVGPVRRRRVAEARVAAAQRQRHEQRAARRAREQPRAAAGAVAEPAHALLQLNTGCSRV